MSVGVYSIRERGWHDVYAPASPWSVWEGNRKSRAACKPKNIIISYYLYFLLPSFIGNNCNHGNPVGWRAKKMLWWDRPFFFFTDCGPFICTFSDLCNFSVLRRPVACFKYQAHSSTGGIWKAQKICNCIGRKQKKRILQFGVVEELFIFGTVVSKRKKSWNKRMWALLSGTSGNSNTTTSLRDIVVSNKWPAGFANVIVQSKETVAFRFVIVDNSRSMLKRGKCTTILHTT